MPERSLSPCIQIPICNTKITLFPELNLPIRVHGTNVRLRMQSGCRVGQKLVKPTFVVKPLFPSFVVQPKASILVKIGGRGGARFCSVLLFFFAVSRRDITSLHHFHCPLFIYTHSCGIFIKIWQRIFTRLKSVILMSGRDLYPDAYSSPRQPQVVAAVAVAPNAEL